MATRAVLLLTSSTFRRLAPTVELGSGLRRRRCAQLEYLRSMYHIRIISDDAATKNVKLESASTHPPKLSRGCSLPRIFDPSAPSLSKFVTVTLLSGDDSISGKLFDGFHEAVIGDYPTRKDQENESSVNTIVNI